MFFCPTISGGKVMEYKKRAAQRTAPFQMLTGMDFPHRIFSFPVKGGEKDPVFLYYIISLILSREKRRK